MSIPRPPKPQTKSLPQASTITCLCKHISLPLPSYSKSPTLPLATELCHCNSCRHASGALSGAFIELHSAPPESILAQCVEYASSAKVRRYFCRNCGSKLFVRGWGVDVPVMWFAWAGNVEMGDDETGLDWLGVTAQAYVEDTLDGGLIGRMIENLRGNEAGRVAIEKQLETVFIQGFDGPTSSLQELQLYYDGLKAQVKDTGAERLQAKCHCGNVEFYVTRPDPEKEYPANTQKYLRCENTKWLARLCLCRSCRSAAGNPLHGWTYVPPEHIVQSDGKAIEFGDVAGLERTLGVKARKDDDVTRSWCGTCGASVFYECEGRYVIDISMGILRSEAGSLAGDFLDWVWDQVSYKGECRVHALLEGVMEKK